MCFLNVACFQRCGSCSALLAVGRLQTLLLCYPFFWKCKLSVLADNFSAQAKWEVLLCYALESCIWKSRGRNSTLRRLVAVRFFLLLLTFVSILTTCTVFCVSIFYCFLLKEADRLKKDKFLCLMDCSLDFVLLLLLTLIYIFFFPSLQE